LTAPCTPPVIYVAGDLLNPESPRLDSLLPRVPLSPGVLVFYCRAGPLS